MRKAIIILFWLLLGVFVLEFSLGVSISNIPGFSLKNIVMYALILGMLAYNSYLGKPLIQVNRITIPIILFILYCLVSLIVTVMLNTVPNYSFVDQGIFLKSYMDPYVLFVVVYSIIHDEKSTTRLIKAMVAVLALFLAITLFSSFGIFDVHRVSMDEKWGRTRGAFAEPNQFAAYLVTFIPLVAVFIMTSRSTVNKLLMGALLLVSLYVLLLLGSRGGLVALIVAVGIFYLLHSKLTLSRSILRLSVVYAASLIVMSVIFLALPEQTASGLMLKLTGKFTDVSQTDYTSGRLDTWAAALKVFLDSPIFGTGWNTFIRIIGWNSHSDYILFLVTTGLVGFYLFVLIYARITKRALLSRKSDPVNEYYYNAFISGFGGFIVAMMFVNIYNPSYFVLIYAALILRLGEVSERDPDEVMDVAEREQRSDNILRRRKNAGILGNNITRSVRMGK